MSLRLSRLLAQLCAGDPGASIAWPTSSEALTRGVRIQASASFDAAASDPAKGRWQWTYRVKISNESAHTLQLLSRHWVIVEKSGLVAEVGPKAPGVLGQQPILRPGESFAYSSACPLSCEAGTLHGSLEMKILEPAELHGRRFEAEIGRFGLATEGDEVLMPIVIHEAL
ncbi:apaG [Symbiodinium natans]|uniref:ApaG protein n=1 Tax=Symbiodinium natans TaxID=878477 RepID=A0A812UDC1_9DINO|nr:apaG [Symbiodinium natans]